MFRIKKRISREPFLFYEMRSTAKLMAEGNSDDAIASQPTDVAKQVCLNHKDLLEFNDETESKYQLTCTTKEKLSYSFEEE